MSQTTWRGVYTALITPFKNDVLDEEGLRKNIRAQIAAKVNGIVPLGTTGETPTLTDQEEERIVQIAVEEAKGKVQILVGTGSNSTKKTIEKTARAKKLGADGALVVSPYYNKPTQEGIFEHYKALVNAVDLPIIVYNIPGRTASLVETTTLKRLAAMKNIVGVKEATGNISNMMDVIVDVRKERPDFSVLCGDDALTLALVSLGGDGVVSVASNLVPEWVVKMVSHALAGKQAEAQELHEKMLPLVKAIFIETNPAPIKQAMNWSGMPAGGVRLPLVELTDKSKTQLKNVLESLNLLRGSS